MFATPFPGRHRLRTLAIAVPALAAALGGSAQARTLYVSAGAASDPSCAAAGKTSPFATIAGALACARNGSTIHIGAGTFAGGFTVAADVTLQGAGAGTLISDPAATPVGAEVTIADGHDVTLRSLTVDGSSSHADVVAGSGSLTVVDSLVRDGFSVSAPGSGIEIAPAAGAATLVVQSSTIADNVSTGGAAGIALVGQPGQPAIAAHVVDSTLSGNQAPRFGAAISAANAVLAIEASTIAGNVSDGSGGGLFLSNGSSATLRGTILAGNSALPAATADCFAFSGTQIASLGHDVVGVGCSTLADGLRFDQVGSAAAPLDPQLGPLAANGGATPTRALLADSPAITAGDAALCGDGPTIDQRGVRRNAAARLACDVGAYDTGGTPLETLYVARKAAGDPACADASRARPFATLAGAVACAHGGSLISIGKGTFEGGVTLPANVVVQGAGPSTIIADHVQLGRPEIAVAERSFVTLRSLTVDGGGLQPDVVSGSGGLTLVEARLTDGFSATGAGGIAVSAGMRAAALTVLRSTIDHDLSAAGAGGIGVAGELDAASLPVVIADTTISDDDGAQGGAVRAIAASLTVRDSTIAGNGAGAQSGGLTLAVSTAVITNTILAGNTAPRAGTADCVAFSDGTTTVASGGGNVVGQGCGGLVDGTGGDVVGSAASPVDPLLAPLAANGGPTPTRALLAGGPAIGIGSAADCQAAPVSGVDQRGRSRAAATRGACDAGAYDTGGM